MAKKQSEKASSEPVKVKIASCVQLTALLISNAGKQVEMSAKDAAYVKEAFKRMEKAQVILQKHYQD